VCSPPRSGCLAKADGTWHALDTTLGKCHERRVPTCGVLREVVLRYAQFGARSVGQCESGERRAVPTRAHMGMEDIGPGGLDDRIDDPWLIVRGLRAGQLGEDTADAGGPGPPPARAPVGGP